MANKYEKLASSTTATQKELWTVAQKNEECANLVARNPAAHDEVLRKVYELLKEDNQEAAAASIFRNKNAPKLLIEEILVETDSPLIERDVDYPGKTSIAVLLASNPNTPAAWVEQLATSKFYMVREQVAARMDLNSSMMVSLATDPVRHVREVLASNPTISPEAASILAQDHELSVRFKLATNAKVHQQVLSRLAESNDAVLRLAAMTAPAYI